jgi:hypothetical protein
VDDDPGAASLPEDPILMSRSHSTLPIAPGPPPEVLAEIGEAWERAQEPLPGGLELHFESEPLLARAWAVLRTADGLVLGRLAASAAIALACGDA